LGDDDFREPLRSGPTGRRQPRSPPDHSPHRGRCCGGRRRDHGSDRTAGGPHDERGDVGDRNLDQQPVAVVWVHIVEFVDVVEFVIGVQSLVVSRDWLLRVFVPVVQLTNGRRTVGRLVNAISQPMHRLRQGRA
jgi:hypothetical protein